ncbi:hypothetical protein ACFSTE_15780 [Aquimarina hainanensis]|uniref:Uncharacterized protein n=1 Tax=Aquimarina hainanensis TaxID=1578017 RepID=A0ABW5NDQ6_9FLAO
MRTYKNITFREGIELSFSEFKDKYKLHLSGMTEEEKKEAHKVATNKNAKLSASSTKSNKVNT